MENKKKLIQEENKKLRRLQLMVDLTLQMLYQEKNLSFKEGLQYIKNARNFALHLYPDKGHVFDLIYKPRFLRVLRERGILDFSHN